MAKSSLQLCSGLISLALLGGCAPQSKPASKTASGPAASVMSYDRFAERYRLDAAAPGPELCDSTCQQRRIELAYVAYVGKQIYCYWDLKKADTGTDFETLASTLAAQITSATTASQYYLLLRTWASAFHDGHVNVMAKGDLTGLELYTAPIRVEVLAPATDHEKLIVSKVSDGTTGLAVGDEITEVDGQSVKDALTRAAAVSSSGSTERMRRFSAGRRLVDVLGADAGTKPLELKLRSFADGSAKSASLYRTVEIDTRPGAPAPAEAPDTGASYLSARVLPGSLGYLRLDAFEGSQDDFLISEAMDRLAQTRGLILDLRQNGGGDLSGDRIIERLASTGVTRYKRSERLSDYVLSQNPEIFPYMSMPDASGRFAQWHDLYVPPVESKHYAKPVVALISPYCFSACDTFSAALKANHLATFIGEPTGGGTGTPLVFDLPLSPYQFRYSVIRGQTPAGELIEGNGTQPDIYLEPTAADRAHQDDRQLKRAIAELESRIAGGSQPAPQPDLAGVPRADGQRLDVSPTRAENDFLLGLGHRDER